jgi:hypothetical protein
VKTPVILSFESLADQKSAERYALARRPLGEIWSTGKISRKFRPKI